MKDGHVAIGRDHVDAVGCHGHLVLCLDYRHGGGALQDFGEYADVVWIEVRHQHESHAAVGRHIAKELLKSLQTACGSTQTDNRKTRGTRLLRFRGGRCRDMTFPDIFFLGHHGILLECPILDSGAMDT
jgi:hypothetical protein